MACPCIHEILHNECKGTRTRYGFHLQHCNILLPTKFSAPFLGRFNGVCSTLPGLAPFMNPIVMNSPLCECYSLPTLGFLKNIAVDLDISFSTCTQWHNTKSGTHLYWAFTMVVHNVLTPLLWYSNILVLCMIQGCFRMQLKNPSHKVI